MEKSDIEQLRHRLHERINQLRQKRNAPGANSAKPKSRDEILSARNKKKEDRKKAIKAQKEKGNNVPTEELVQVDKKVILYFFFNVCLSKMCYRQTIQRPMAINVLQILLKQMLMYSLAS